MIRRRGQPGPALTAAQMIAALENHLNQVKAWLKDKSKIAVHYVEHNDLVRQPSTVAEALRDLLPGLDVEAMARQVDPALYRQRA